MRIHKSQIGDAGLEILRERNRFRRALPQQIGQPMECLTPFLLDAGRSRIAGKKRLFRIRVSGNPVRDLQGQPRMAVKRFVLRARQKQSRENLSKEVDDHAGITPS
jgi:hypothetical protein